jgi:hypothetical protein
VTALRWLDGLCATILTPEAGTNNLAASQYRHTLGGLLDGPLTALRTPYLIRLRMTASLQEYSPRISTGSCSLRILPLHLLENYLYSGELV